MEFGELKGLTFIKIIVDRDIEDEDDKILFMKQVAEFLKCITTKSAAKRLR